MLPYFASLIFLVILLVKAFVQAYIYEKGYHTQDESKHDKINDLLIFLEGLYIAPFVLFISLRTFEVAILSSFLGF